MYTGLDMSFHGGSAYSRELGDDIDDKEKMQSLYNFDKLYNKI